MDRREQRVVLGVAVLLVLVAAVYVAALIIFAKG